MQLFGLSISNEELFVIAVIVLGAAAFEAGPAILNVIRNRRQKK
jgi:hypothetical protein